MKSEILETGVKLLRKGLHEVTARKIGREFKVAHGTVVHYFGRNHALQDAVAAHAIETRDLRAMANLIVAQHPRARAISGEDRMICFSGML